MWLLCRYNISKEKNVSPYKNDYMKGSFVNRKILKGWRAECEVSLVCLGNFLEKAGSMSFYTALLIKL